VWTAGGLVVALLVGVGLLGLRLRGNITVVDVNDALADSSTTLEDDPADPADPADPQRPVSSGEARDEAPSGPLNILVMGSDTREGQGDGFGSAALIEGARSDTTILVHLSADRDSVVAVSIPRDLMVTLPSCTMPDGTTTYPYVDRFNAAFSIGGPECTIRTVTELTGLPIHHFVVVDFTAFERTIDALGGVEVCLTRPVDDPLSGLDVPAGVTRVDGEQGLAFVRARATLGDGSDLARIERQQAFLGSLVREATSRELLTDPLRLVRSLDAATQSLTMDSGLAWLPRSTAIARSLAGIDPSEVAFVTYPNTPNDDLLTVRPDEAAALLLVEVLAADAAWPLPPSEQAVKQAPDQATVSVVNATGRDDQASIVGAALSRQGFAVAGLSAVTASPTTEVRYPPQARQVAETVAAAVDGAVLVPDDSRAGVVLVLGTEFRVDLLRTVRVAAPPVTDQPSDAAGTEGWTAPDDERPAGETVTAETSVCAD
jgi:LCP family protein required for cell wall assembly